MFRESESAIVSRALQVAYFDVLRNERKTDD